MAKLSGLLRTTDPDLGALAAAARDLRPTGVPGAGRRGPRGTAAVPGRRPRAGRRPHRARRHRHRPGGRGPRRRRGGPARLATPSPCCPSWETLPHERLSPRPDTVGRRLALFRRLADPATAPPAVVVAAARSLIQPIAPGLGQLDPVTLRVGDVARLRRRAGPAGRAGLHPGRDGHRARRVRRPRRDRRRLPADGRAPGAGRVLGRRGQRAAQLRRRRPALRRARRRAVTRPAAGSCCSPTRSRQRAAALARDPREQPAAARAAGAPGRGHPGRGHGVADPGAGRRRAGAADRPAAGRRAGAARRSGADPHPQRGPGPHRPGVPGGVAGSPRRSAATRRSTWARAPTAASTRCSTHARRLGPPGRHADAAGLGPATTSSRRPSTRSSRTAATPTGR